MPPSVEVRQGQRGDAADAVEVLTRSIADLCAADHGGDGAEIAAWTANKTETSWLSWLADPTRHVFVGLLDGRIVGIGMMTTAGRIELNYVHPDARFRGVSKALMMRMEAEAKRKGLAACHLESTQTAAPFYAALGYRSLTGERMLTRSLGQGGRRRPPL